MKCQHELYVNPVTISQIVLPPLIDYQMNRKMFTHTIQSSTISSLNDHSNLVILATPSLIRLILIPRLILLHRVC
jgi:hypothetical protein